MIGKLIFTVDLDRDVNLPLEGAIAAGSIDRGEGTSPRFSSAERGLSILLDVLDDVGMPATFFVEGRTSGVMDCSCLSGHCIGFHGYDHEDLTGASTGVPLSDGELEGILRAGYDAVSDGISVPQCFRAPFMSCDDRVLGAVAELGIKHDSSFYAPLGTQPYVLDSGMVEHPVPKCRDGSGRNMAAYLWPMHEGKRSPADYTWMAESSGGGDLVLATHTWHMVERRESGLMDRETVQANAENLREVLAGIIDMGFRPSVMAD